MDAAVSAIREGAYYQIIKSAIAKRNLELENQSLRHDLDHQKHLLSRVVNRRDSLIQASQAISGLYELPDLLST